MFDFGKISLFFLKGSTVYTYKQFKEDKSLHSNIAIVKNYDTSKFDEIERCYIFLEDGRIFKNIFVFKGRMLLEMTYWSLNGGFIHDAIEKYLFNITENLYTKYLFNSIDIKEIVIKNDSSKRVFNLFSNKLNDSELLVSISKDEK